MWVFLVGYGNEYFPARPNLTVRFQNITSPLKQETVGGAGSIGVKVIWRLEKHLKHIAPLSPMNKEVCMCSIGRKCDKLKVTYWIASTICDDCMNLPSKLCAFNIYGQDGYDQL